MGILAGSIQTGERTVAPLHRSEIPARSYIVRTLLVAGPNPLVPLYVESWTNSVISLYIFLFCLPVDRLSKKNIKNYLGVKKSVSLLKQCTNINIFIPHFSANPTNLAIRQMRKFSGPNFPYCRFKENRKKFLCHENSKKDIFPIWTFFFSGLSAPCTLPFPGDKRHSIKLEVFFYLLRRYA